MSNAVKVRTQFQNNSFVENRLAAEAVVDAALLTNEALSLRSSWADSSSEFRESLVEDILNNPERTAELFSASFFLN